MQKKTGILIAIEGIDGAGKSTFATGLAKQLHDSLYPKKQTIKPTIALTKKSDVILTKEPGGTQLGKQLRAILQQQTTPLNPKTEFLLFAADRAQHFQDIIIPALDNGHIVISDRMDISSLVYQGYGRGLDLPMLKTINSWAMAGYAPDLLFYLKIDSETAKQRIIARNKQLTSFEKEDESFIQKLITGFDDLLVGNPHCLVLDGTLDPEMLVTQATEKIITWHKKQE